MLGRGNGARRFNDVVTLTYAAPTRDDFGHVALADAVAVKTIYADVQRMSATKTMMTFQQADVVGLEIEFRNPGEITYNGLRWHGHDVNFSAPERLDNRGRFIRIQGWYQADDPEIPAPAPAPTTNDETPASGEPATQDPAPADNTETPQD